MEFQTYCFQVKFLIKTSNYGRSKMIFVIEKHIILSPESCVELTSKRCSDDKTS